MIHQHHHSRHHYAFSHYILYLILAIAAVALVFLLVNMIIPEIPSIQTSPAFSPLISPQQRVQQYWQFEASRWQAMGDAYVQSQQRVEQYWKFEASRWEAIADGYTKNTRPLNALDKRLTATKQYLISPLDVDQHTYNLIAQYVPGLLSTEPLTDSENYGYNYFKQHRNNDR